MVFMPRKTLSAGYCLVDRLDMLLPDSCGWPLLVAISVLYFCS